MASTPVRGSSRPALSSNEPEPPRPRPLGPRPFVRPASPRPNGQRNLPALPAMGDPALIDNAGMASSQHSVAGRGLRRQMEMLDLRTGVAAPRNTNDSTTPSISTSMSTSNPNIAADNSATPSLAAANSATPSLLNSHSGRTLPSSSPPGGPSPSARSRQRRYLADARQLLAIKQQITDRYYHFHRGPLWFNAWHPDARRPFWTRLLMPPERGAWPGHAPIQPGERFAPARRYEGALRPRIPPGVMRAWNGFRARASAGLDLMGRRRFQRGPKPVTERRVLGALAGRLRAEFEPAGVKFKRNLGFGGMGAVFLCEVVSESGPNLPVVIKGQLLPGRTDQIEREVEYLNYMNGAAHFLQRIHLSALPLPSASRRRKLKSAARSTISLLSDALLASIQLYIIPQTPTPPTALPPPDGPIPRGYTASEIHDIRERRADIDTQATMIVLDFMPRGDLHNLICKLVARRWRLSDRALWMIFQCLFKACVGMATPGRFWEAGRNPSVDPMRTQEETVLPNLYDGTRVPRMPLVHFDMDPQNALVGDFGEEGSDHEFIPVCKVSDPGCAMVVDDNVRGNEFELWNKRVNGKTDHFLPEQFTREWEYTAALDGLALAAEPTAGQYNWWSNLYQVGLIMFQLVTHCLPDVPPRAWPYNYTSETSASWTLDQQGHSYGLGVMAPEYANYDEELRFYIVRCLDHQPSKRPTMGFMEGILIVNVNRPDLLQAESDEELRAQMNRIFGEP